MKKHKFGIYSSDKCSAEELKHFKKQVCDFWASKGIDVSKIKIRCQKNYGGNIKIPTYTAELTNQKTSIRKCDDGNYYRGHFETRMTFGVYFYRTEWQDYLQDIDQQEFDLADIKKYYFKIPELKKLIPRISTEGT